MLDQAGNLYGATFFGGAHDYGTVFKLSPITKGKKKGTWTEKILYSFKGGEKDGYGPFAGIVFDAAGNIYGTTVYGGRYGADGIAGTVYELAPRKSGGYKEKLLWSFNNTDGAGPLDSVILDSAGNIYGTTSYGGPNHAGVVFEVTP
jgi:uncharacterized repeat protein (TIGR03803 family)